MSSIGEKGTIRFISGSWGAGKTHFFRLFREVSFENNCLVSNVQLNADDAALNKFERVFYSIIKNIATPSCFEEGSGSEIAPFGQVLKESLAFLSKGSTSTENGFSYEDFVKAREALMVDRSIDIDFRKMVEKYWETFLPESPDPAIQEQNRAEILQWFSGEGSKSFYSKRFGVNKIVSKDNAKLMLQSLAGFIKLAGYRGLVILFDEAEQAYSIMRKSSLKDAHNNLLSLINNIEALSGLFLIYATTPDFFNDPKHGIIIYGALSGRIGKPESRKPKALDKIWNFDEVSISLEDYQAAASKIRQVYTIAYPEAEAELPSNQKIKLFIKDLFSQHSEFAGVRFWRVMVTALVTCFDDCQEGEERTVEEIYVNVMDRLREE
ncbi:BREX system ATP-binding domain-containing protein [Egbenema bharatensis]|uniref:BREX system ATP-binding domain-containing protein n=1 Tax=Egbenema bharatensis TaxID=3463334 RepID=UPI003A885F89